MKNVFRIVAVMLPLVGGATLAMVQSNLEQAVVTGSENNTREFLGLPLLDDHGAASGTSGSEDNTGENFGGGVHKPHGSSARRRTHIR